jgi:hypothetical protein
MARAKAKTVTVYLTNVVKTSAGTGPGVLQLPPDEAARLVAGLLAVYGDQPPMGFSQ